MLKLFRVDHPNAEELKYKVVLSAYEACNIDYNFHDKYRKLKFVIFVYAESIEEIKKQYKQLDHGGYDSNIYYEAFQSGTIKEVTKISDLDDVNYYIKGKSIFDEWLPDICINEEYSYDYEEYVSDFLRKNNKD